LHKFLAKHFAWDIKPNIILVIDSGCFFSTAEQIKKRLSVTTGKTSIKKIQ